MRKKHEVNAIIVISVFLLFALSNLTPLSFQKELLVFDGDDETREWIQMIGDGNGTYPGGFGTPSNLATRGIAIYDGEVYVGTQNLDVSPARFFNLKFWVTVGLLSYHLFEPAGRNTILLKLINIGVPLQVAFGSGCEVWKYNHTSELWTPVVSNAADALIASGFGHRYNFAASVIVPYKGKLYIGTGASASNGCEIWRWDGATFERVAEKGFGDGFNSGIWCAAEYNDELYIGTMNWNTGCQLWKTSDGVNWIKVELPEGDGFGSYWNVYAWSMCLYNNSLFVGTCNINRSRGCQLWRYDGSEWHKIPLPGGDGFGDPNNYGIRNFVVYDNELYVSSSTSYVHSTVACEIWKYDGTQWYPIISDNVDSILGDGFDDTYNKYAWSMIKTSEDNLIVGTLNLQPLVDGAPFNTYGCELWQYDGHSWTEVVGRDSLDETLGGFGDTFNIGARTMIEYPEGSGIIMVGTWNLDTTSFKKSNGCEIWQGLP